MKMEFLLPQIQTADDYPDFEYMKKILVDFTGDLDIDFMEGEELIDGDCVACFYKKGQEAEAIELLIESYSVNEML